MLLPMDVQSAIVEDLSMLLLPMARRQVVSRPEVASKDNRCGASAKTGALLGARQVSCVRARGHEGIHASMPRQVVPQIGRFRGTSGRRDRPGRAVGLSLVSGTPAVGPVVGDGL